jgi:hypothetical protein
VAGTNAQLAGGIETARYTNAGTTPQRNHAVVDGASDQGTFSIAFALQ